MSFAEPEHEEFGSELPSFVSAQESSLEGELSDTGDGDRRETGDGDRRDTDDGNRRRDAFARLFAKHDRWLHSYLVSLLGGTAPAEEVFQEVCVVLWREYEKFELGTDFVKWVAVIAHNQVRKFRRQRRQDGFQLKEVAFDLLAAEAVERADLFDHRRDALRRCLAKLPAVDRSLVEQCYEGHKVNFKETAHQLGRPENTVYKALNRIRRVLFECINRTLTSEGLL